MRALLALLLLAAAPALAQAPLDGAGFEALSTGQSFSIANPGEAEAYGVERYFPGRRVTWRWIETGLCEEGTWFESDDFAGGPAICFDYGPDQPLQCWHYRAAGDGLAATFLGQPESPLKEQGFRIDPAPGAAFCDWLGS